MADDTRPIDDGPGPFTHGVASFDPTPDSVILWARVAPGHGGTVRWCVAPATDVAPSAEGTVEAPASADGCVAVPVEGLLPATTYRYWFEAGGRRSPVGRARTLPATGTDRFRVAVVCCADYSQGHFGVYRAVAEAEVDLVLHVGDYIYESPGRGDSRPAEPDRTLVTLDDYRARYAQTRADPDLLALHERHPVVAIWDDHDIADNAWRHGAKAHDEAEHGPWEDRLAAAARAWHEWLPSRRPAGRGPYAIWRSLAIGDLAELVLLDTRIDGRDEHADHEGSPALDDPARSLLGDEQRRWAHERIRDTSRPWCLVATGVVLNRLELPVPAGATVSDHLPSGYAVLDGKALCTDEWDGYPAERDRLVAAMAERGAGVVVLSGDVHSAWAFEGPLGPDGEPVAVEFTATCVTSTPMGAQLPRGWRALASELAERVPEARWFELERHGFTVLDIDAERVRAEWFSVDITRPAVTPEPVAAWAVTLDRPGRLTGAPVTAGRPAAPAGSSAARAADEAAVAVPPRPDGVGPPPPHRARWLVPALVAVAAGGLWLRRHAARGGGR